MAGRVNKERERKTEREKQVSLQASYKTGIYIRASKMRPNKRGVHSAGEFRLLPEQERRRSADQHTGPDNASNGQNPLL